NQRCERTCSTAWPGCEELWEWRSTMDDERLVRDIERLAQAALESSRARPVGARRPGRSVLVAALSALVLLGAIGLAALRRESVTDIATQPNSPGTASTASPAPATTAPSPTELGTTPGTIASLTYPAHLPGTEIFRHASVDGHALLIGRLVNVPRDCTT